MNQSRSILVVFNSKFPNKGKRFWRKFDTILAPEGLANYAKDNGLEFKNINELRVPGSFQEGSHFAEKLSNIILPNGEKVSKIFTYKDFELWWIYYNVFHLQFGIPYTQYSEVLKYLIDFKKVYLYKPEFQDLFECYLSAHGSKVVVLKHHSLIPIGLVLQFFITLISIPILMIKRPALMVFIGDKFQLGKDYDFRMGFIYEELMKRKLSFFEFIRSLESWKSVLRNSLTRRRAAIYPEAIAQFGRILSTVTGGRRLGRRKFGPQLFDNESDPDKRFMYLVSTKYLSRVYDDIWAIRITRLIFKLIGVKAAIIIAALERNFHAVIASKLEGIPTVGIMHGTSYRDINVYDFMTGFDDKKILSVDKYGVWSNWWKEYFIENSKAYKAEQLFVSGPMRPLAKDFKVSENRKIESNTRVLLIAEQAAVPEEVMPYLKALIDNDQIELTIKFRSYRDGFEDWLKVNFPEILNNPKIKKFKGTMQDAVQNNDVVVGSHSTGVLEALLQEKVPIFMSTKKWADNNNIENFDENHTFYAYDPSDFIEKIKNASNISIDSIRKLKERYFGDPYQNGSKWVVDEVEKIISQRQDRR